jgi:Putative Ig domain
MRNPMSGVRKWATALVAMLLAACGGGGGGSSGPAPTPPPAAPTGLSYPTPPVFNINSAITALNPTVTGSVTGYAVTPALPAGLTLNSSTGVISGTPTVSSFATSYQVVASNAGGSTSTTISIRVNDLPPSVTYPRSNYTFSTHVPVITVTPSVTGGAATAWTIAPALPAGLAFDTSTGAITGTPSQITSSATYLVTAQNPGGSDTFDLLISVQTESLLELGHTGPIEEIRQTATRILSWDAHTNVSLFDAATGRKIMHTGASSASFSTENRVWLCDDTALVLNGQFMEVRSAINGALTTSVDVGAMYVGVANDCSYFWATNNLTFRVWSRAGQLLFSRANDAYRGARIIGMPGELRVAGGPAAPNGVETITVPGNVSSIAPGTFNGVFLKWFSDGSHFLTTAGNSVWVYTSNVVQQSFLQPGTLDGLDGRGNRFWTFASNTLNIYAVGAGTTPLVTYAFNSSSSGRISADKSLLAFIDDSRNFSVIDLTPATPTRTDYNNFPLAVRRFGAATATDFTVGDSRGIMVGELPSGGGDPLMYSLGAIKGLAAGAAYIAVATSFDTTRIYNTQTRALEQELNLGPSEIQMSADGTALATWVPTSQNSLNGQLVVRSLPSLTVLASYDFANTGLQLRQFRLHDSGQIISLATTNGSDQHTRSVSRLDGTVLWSDTVQWNQYLNNRTFPMQVVSPDASTIAIPPLNPGPTAGPDIYRNGTLLTTLVGWPSIWLTNDRIVVHKPETTGGLWTWSLLCEIVDLGNPPVNCGTQAFGNVRQVVSATSAYKPNEIRDLFTGAVTWQSPHPSVQGIGSLAGDSVVFQSFTLIRIEPR